MFAVLGAAAIAAGGAHPNPAIGAFGLDLGGRDRGVKPGVDFARFAGGGWQRTEQIPADRSSWTQFDRLREQSMQDVREILEAAASGSAHADSSERQIGDYYAAYLDVAAIEAKGLDPAAPGLVAIASVASYEDVARLMARVDMSLPGPIEFAINLDAKNPDRYLVEVDPGGLGLPDRDYYLRDDAGFPEIRAQYRAHIGRLLALAGDLDSAAMAGRILKLETEIAKLHWPRAEWRDRDRTYNLKTRGELKALATDFPWDAALGAAELDESDELVVTEPSATGPLALLFHATPLADWRGYLRYHYLRANAAQLPAAIEQEVFAFFGRTLNGQPDQQVRWKRAVEATNQALGESIGKLYVKRHFPPAAKAEMLALVGEMRAAFADRIATLDWMTPATKVLATEKLAKLRTKIGYPNKWRDYSALEVRRDDAFGNHARAALFEWHRQVVRLNQPTDRDEWLIPPQAATAYYYVPFNEIVFPAAILQPPFFDPAADPAVNFGAIGGVIGHEMGHGFDDQGSKSDAHGVLHTWWGESDVAAFRARTDRLAEQYNRYEPLPGIHVNGRLTLGENIGDLGGLTVAFDAYHASLHGRKAPVLAQLSGEQRFFLGWAQIWRARYRDERLRNLVLSDFHSPYQYRINGVVRNIDAWYAAFGVTPGDALYLAPAERVQIW
jgi:putative endopeptidase